MKFVTSLLNRRAFVALAAASMLAGAMHSAPASAADVTIPIIVKDTTSFYWQIVLAGARKAGKDLGVNVPELGAQAETDVNGQISILENAVAGNPAAVVIAPTEAKALGKPIDEAASKVKVIGIDSSADSKAFTSFLTTDNVQGGRVAADGLAAAIGAANGGKVEGKVALITALPGAGSLEQRAQGFKEQLKAKYPGLELIAVMPRVCFLKAEPPIRRGGFARSRPFCCRSLWRKSQEKRRGYITVARTKTDGKPIGAIKVNAVSDS
jgi:ribose transport system substrate-binding protein